MQADKYQAEEMSGEQERATQAAAAAAVGGIVGEVVVKSESSASAVELRQHCSRAPPGLTTRMREARSRRMSRRWPRRSLALEGGQEGVQELEEVRGRLARHVPLPEAKGKTNDELDLVEDLMNLDMGVLYTHLEKMDTGRQLYGWIPSMACNSYWPARGSERRELLRARAQLREQRGDHGNTLLSDEEVEMLVILRMNRDFMSFMREHYGAEAKQTVRADCRA